MTMHRDEIREQLKAALAAMEQAADALGRESEAAQKDAGASLVKDYQAETGELAGILKDAARDEEGEAALEELEEAGKTP